MLLILLAALGCSPTEPPVDRAGAAEQVERTSSGRTVRTIREDGARSTRVEVELEDGSLIEVAPHDNADRAVLSEDGRHVAWVSGHTGLASVWVSEVRAGAEPIQVTNVGIEPTPGRAPDGWTPPPHDDSLHFEGDHLVWDSPQGPQRERWR